VIVDDLVFERDRFERMFETSDDTTVRRLRRVEVFTGPERRREWPDERKIVIVAESLSPGVNISEVARRHHLNPQQLFGWRRRLRPEAEALLASRRREPEAITFAPVQVEAQTANAPSPLPTPASGEGSIEITVGVVTVRIKGAVDGRTLAVVLKALRVLA
jgi:transposase